MTDKWMDGRMNERTFVNVELLLRLERYPQLIRTKTTFTSFSDSLNFRILLRKLVLFSLSYAFLKCKLHLFLHCNTVFQSLTL